MELKGILFKCRNGHVHEAAVGGVWLQMPICPECRLVCISWTGIWETPIDKLCPRKPVQRYSDEFVDSLIRQRVEANKAMLAAERDRDHYIEVIRNQARGIAPSQQAGDYVSFACGDGIRFHTANELRDIALAAEAKLKEMKK